MIRIVPLWLGFRHIHIHIEPALAVHGDVPAKLVHCLEFYKHKSAKKKEKKTTHISFHIVCMQADNPRTNMKKRRFFHYPSLHK